MSPQKPNTYKAYVSHVSYYSGKLEAYLRYKEIPHRRIELNAKLMREVLLPATGVMKMPAMQCPDGRWLKDTTPMLQWLDAQHPDHPVYPQDPATRFLSLLVEDYADEWMWRPAMYYRWAFRDSHQLLRHRLGAELAHGTAYPAWLLGWYMRWRQYIVFVRGDGVRPHNRAHVEALYLRSLQQLSALLKDRPFLLGDRPTIVDFGFFASMFRHYTLDPAPAKIMVDTAPRVLAWTARMWAARGSEIVGDRMDDFSDPAWQPMFRDMARDYLPYLDDNARHYAAGDKRFDSQIDGVRYPAVPVVRYRVACREILLREWMALHEDSRTRIRERLADSGIANWLDAAPAIPAGLDEEFQLPLQQRYPAARGLYGLKLLTGTPWDRPRPGITKAAGTSQR